jgi:repressor LexA
MMKKLTARQQRVLDLTRDYIADKGYPPTLRELADGLGVGVTRGVVKHLEALERKGYLKRSPGASRGIELASRTAPQARDAALVPVLGRVPAGPMELAVEEYDDSLVLDQSVAGEGTFLLRVTGDSMSGDHITIGDLVLVKKQETAESGDLVVAMVEDEATVKRLRMTRGRIILEPSNPDYLPMEFDSNSPDLSIIGKVKAVVRLLDRV